MRPTLTTLTAVTPVTAQPLLLTPEPWNLLVTQTPAKEKAKEGETVVLNCHLNSPQHPSLSDLMVKWYKEDERGQMDLLEKNVAILPNNSRIFMSGNLSQGDVSLIILNVTTSDHGIYFCEVTLPDGKILGILSKEATCYVCSSWKCQTFLFCRLNRFQSQRVNTLGRLLSYYLINKKYLLLCQQ
uniref:Ig-like domain-containing protein n=1 Tax=Zosterops lateralis melanops TaxID=1220523 RepID=A0A8D2QNM4_ZOSLA